MNLQSYLIDTNILIGLEDNHTVNPAYARFLSLSTKHKVDVFVHAAAMDDIARDKDLGRRKISLSKVTKYRVLSRRRGLTEAELAQDFGRLKKPNDVVDAILLNALKIGAVDFLVTQDKGLHQRALRHSTDMARRVLFVSDAADLLIQTYEPKEVPIRHVADVAAHTINHEDSFFDSLRDGYQNFDMWWNDKCIKQRRPCWVVYDDENLAGLIVRKDETGNDTDAVTKSARILKVCTFKVRPEMRGVKLGELLLKQVLWFAQSNAYDLAYLTTFEDQTSLIDLLEYYGFIQAGSKPDGELIYERSFASSKLVQKQSETVFQTTRQNYPRFLVTDKVRCFGIPIQEDYHDTLYPDLWKPRQADLFVGASRAESPSRPGNTIRKVYLCRASSKLAEAGSILFFYKSSSMDLPSRAITAVGVLEEVTLATSTKDLMLKTGGRSVYSEEQLDDWQASPENPVKVINYLLLGYVEPPIGYEELKEMKVVRGYPQSIFEIKGDSMKKILSRANLGFDV